MKVFLNEFAKLDLTEIESWYDEQQAGLAEELMRALFDCMDQLERNPMMYEEVRRGVRRALLRRFPYGVYYTIHSDRIEVLAVYHESRDPDAWEVRDVDAGLSYRCSRMPRPKMQIPRQHPVQRLTRRHVQVVPA